jgi:hypothetical protein
MSKLIVILWVAFTGAVASGVITFVKLSGAVDDLERSIEEQDARLDELSDAVGRMTHVVRQVATVSSMRADDDSMLEPIQRPRARAQDGSLEAQVDELSELILPYKDLMDRELRRRDMRAAARERMEADRERYSEEELDEMRELYRGSRGSRGDPERRENLEELVEKYPDSSVAGCALYQLGRGAEGAQAESYYLRAIQGHSDSYCHGGTQVGALARDRLADWYEENGQEAKAKRLRIEIKREYPGALDHRGNPL